MYDFIKIEFNWIFFLYQVVRQFVPTSKAFFFLPSHKGRHCFFFFGGLRLFQLVKQK